MPLGLVLAGGRARRFGAEKAVARLGGETLLERACSRLAAHCDAVAVSAPLGSGAAALAASLGLEVLEDPRGSPRGPLSGILAGLDWAQARKADRLLTLPCDSPLVPPDLEARLLAALGEAPAAVARSPSGQQPLCGVWRVWMHRALRSALADGLHPPVRQVLGDAGAVWVDFPEDEAFLNINTPEDLALAERRFVEQNPI
jgi:molybdopterin-guanine dinucleotide biosynthesis protein A